MSNRVQHARQIPFVTLSPEAQASVRERAALRGKLNEKTLMGGDGNATGFTGEELVRAHIPGLSQDAHNRDYDFKADVLPNGLGGTMDMTFDVKSRRIKVPPRLNFDCKIPAYQVKRQKAEAYIFTAPNEALTGGWLLGWIWKEDFLAEASLFRKGYKHPSGIVLKEDHYFITVDKLFPVGDLVDFMQRINASKAA